MPVTLSDEDFLLLYEYFAESFGTIVDNSRMAEVIKMGYAGWARLQDIAKTDERFAHLPGDQIDAMRAELEARD